MIFWRYQLQRREWTLVEFAIWRVNSEFYIKKITVQNYPACSAGGKMTQMVT